MPPANPIPPSLNEPVTPPPATMQDLTSSASLVPSRDSEKFITKVSMLTSEQLRLSQIAAQRATNTQVRSFAQQVETSTHDLQQEIDRIAQTKNVIVPTGKTAQDAADDERKWQNKDGKDFDEDYVERIIKIHQDAVDTLAGYSGDKDADPEIAALAGKHLPTMREHLRQAQSLKDQAN